MLVAISLLLLVGSMWGFYCNHKTWSDRRSLLKNINATDPNWREKFDEFDQISYEKHLLHRFLFLNPKDLYKLNK